MSESLHDLRPYYDPSTFDAGYSVTYQPGVGVLYPNKQSLVETIFNNELSSKANKSLNKFRPGISNNSRSLRSSSLLKDDEGISASLKQAFNNSSEILSNFFKKLAKAYFKVIINQPFDIVRLCLQVGSFNITSKKKVKKVSKKSLKKNKFEEDESASFFFTNNNELNDHKDFNESESEEEEEPDVLDNALSIKQGKFIQPLSLNTIDVMSSILSKEDTTSLWKATNVSYIYQSLFKTLESWFTGFFAGILEIPDPQYIDINYSTDPFKSLILILVASTITGLLLAPLDLIRTKLIVTVIPSNSVERMKLEKKNPSLKRSLRDNIRMLKFCRVPIQLIFPTLINSFMNKFVKNFIQYLIVTNYSNLNPIYTQLSQFFSEFIDLGLKLPIETLLRRCQVSYLLSKSHNDDLKDSIGLEIDQDDLMVDFIGYNGLFTSNANNKKSNDNSGIESYFRGWKIAVLNIFARWGIKIVNVDSKFVEEKF